MQFRRTLPGRSSTDFLFTEPEIGGLSTDRQLFIADLVMEYRRKYPMLMINVVWDFGIEEGDPVKGEKYGVFEQCRDNAVYNAQMLTISLNHARVGKMPREADPEQIRWIEEYYESYADLQAVFAEKRRHLSCDHGSGKRQGSEKVSSELFPVFRNAAGRSFGHGKGSWPFAALCEG